MRFEVPQFIDIEDKIFGPLTFKQFIYLIGGGGLSYVSYKLVPFPFSWILIIAFVAIACALAFYKVNNRPFIEVAQSWMTYMIKGKLYIWKRTMPTKQQPTQTKPVVAPKTVKDISAEQISALSQNLDILDSQ